MTELAGARVLITGAGSGMGRALAERVAAEGGHVILWDVRAEAAEAVRSDLEARGHKAHAYRCDVSDRSSVRDAARAVLEEHGAVDVLINNAGVVAGKPLLELSDAEIERTLDVNLTGLFWVTRAFLPVMAKRNRGHVVTIASAGGLCGVSKLTDYCASKFGAVGFDEALRLELRRQRLAIQTTVVCPFYVRTGMFEGVRTRFAWLLPLLETEQVVERILRAVRRNRRRVLMPRFLYLVWPSRLLPTFLFDALLGFLGVNRSMDEFVGRRGGP